MLRGNIRETDNRKSQRPHTNPGLPHNFIPPMPGPHCRAGESRARTGCRKIPASLDRMLATIRATRSRSGGLLLNCAVRPPESRTSGLHCRRNSVPAAGSSATPAIGEECSSAGIIPGLVSANNVPSIRELGQCNSAAARTIGNRTVPAPAIRSSAPAAVFGLRPEIPPPPRRLAPVLIHNERVCVPGRPGYICTGPAASD